uniref:Uncharacterized protein n=1 Tax=Anguilla anguilla TaxID=7936 RepID=A0A0E9RC69_ANGAN
MCESLQAHKSNNVQQFNKLIHLAVN